MFKLLFATDGSDAARGALAFIQALALPEGSAVRAVCVIPSSIGALYPAWPVLVQAHEGEAAWAKSVVDEARAALARPGIEVTSEVRDGDVAHELLEMAREFAADLVVLGSHGHGALEEFLLG